MSQRLHWANNDDVVILVDPKGIASVVRRPNNKESEHKSRYESVRRSFAGNVRYAAALAIRFIIRGLSLLFISPLIIAILCPIFTSDWFTLLRYHPPYRISEVASIISLTDYGRDLFYVNDPEIVDDKQTFRAHCRVSKERSSVLGCHTPDGKIFVFGAPNSDLSGIVESVSAHELLHAGYDRLSSGEKQHVLELIRQVTDKNPEILHKLDPYAGSSETVMQSELHSFVGTEVSALPPELEKYYSRYFRDRETVVRLYTQYESKIDSQQKLVELFDSQLSNLMDKIESEKNDIGRTAQELTEEQGQIRSWANEGDPEEHNSLVRRVNTKASDFNIQVRKANRLVSEYNSLIEQRNALAFEARETLGAIDTSLYSH